MERMSWHKAHRLCFSDFLSYMTMMFTCLRREEEGVEGERREVSARTEKSKAREHLCLRAGSHEVLCRMTYIS